MVDHLTFLGEFFVHFFVEKNQDIEKSDCLNQKSHNDREELSWDHSNQMEADSQVYLDMFIHSILFESIEKLVCTSELNAHFNYFIVQRTVEEILCSFSIFSL